MTTHDRLEALDRTTASTASARYFAEYGPVARDHRVELQPLPEGLLVAHLVAAADGDDVLHTYWASNADFQRDGPRLAARIVGARLLRAGLVGPPVRHAKRWYQKLTPLTMVLSATTFLGAMDALYNRYELWFEAPAVTISPDIGATGVLNSVEGEHLVLKATIRNPLGIALGDLVVAGELTPSEPSATQTDKGRTVALAAAEPQIIRMSPGETRSMRFDAANVPSGDWTAVLHVSAEAGALRSRKSFVGRAKVHVWPRLTARRSEWKSRGGVAGVMQGWIDAGAAPSGIRCNVQISRIPGLARGRLSSSHGVVSQNWMADAAVGGQEIYLMEWSTGPLDRYQRIGFELFVDAPADTNWGLAHENTEVKCFHRQAGG